MRSLLLTLMLVPTALLAAEHYDSPLLIGQSQEMAQATAPVAPGQMENFPEWAVTKVGENSAGNLNPVPATPADPAAAPGAPLPQTMSGTTAPTSPVAPASPITKLWPIDTIPIFMKSCMGFHIELAAPCKCVITNLMVEMPHDEFLRLSAAGAIEQDQRLANIRYRCIGTPARE